ncbi:MAG: M23 family metallopeptidase [Flavobacteriales bacterium]|nr:M23 family metallopeptidase [Flavobacteriales bacterium]MCB9197021.1 M23 family metallopeptidase [Flavobacteriales bacterium]
MSRLNAFGSIILFLFFYSIATAQEDNQYKDVNFTSPLGIDLVLAGNFAEMRSNHFHTGLDIKTNGREGYKIYAVDSGYISRINISHWGYGNVIYITHPSGFTSVYAHLSTFPPKVLDYIRKKQFSEESETVQIYPSKEELVVKKGEVVAFSGNSGSSTAPHLHFEIRETASENPLNPLLFNFDIKDTKKPVLLDVKVYPLEGGLINGKKKDYNIDLIGNDGEFKRAYDQPIKFKGSIGLSLNTIDYLDGAGNQCGIFTIELLVDNDTIFKQKMDRLDFSTNRYINTHADYLDYRINKQSYHKSFVAENNKLEIYEKIKNNGRIVFDDTLVHTFKYVVKDVYGNMSIAQFNMQSEGLGEPELPLGPDHLIDASSRNLITEDGFEAELPKYTVYEDLKYQYQQSQISNSYAPLHQFHDDYTPVQQYFVLRLKSKGIPQGFEDKALIVEMSKNGKVAYSKGGEFSNGWVKTEVRSFGDYTIKIDTVAPVIKTINVVDGKDVSSQEFIQFSILDNLSGIDDYDVYVDGVWKLAFYNVKMGTLTLNFDEYNKISKGEHIVKVVVKDERKNRSELELKIIR